MKEKIALIGVNGFGRFHLNNLLELHKNGTIDLVAAVVRNRKKAAFGGIYLEMVKVYPRK